MYKSKPYKTPLKAIRAHCIACGGGSLAEVRYCTVVKCELWIYRMGKRPKLSSDVPQKVSLVNLQTMGQRERENEFTF